MNKSTGLNLAQVIILSVVLNGALYTPAQGTIGFSNFAGGPIRYLDGTPVTSGFKAQLWGGPEGTPVSEMHPYFPMTYFSTEAGAEGYIQATVITANDIPYEGIGT